jgi:hypothetical protein
LTGHSPAVLDWEEHGNVKHWNFASLLRVTYVNARKEELTETIKTFEKCLKVGIPNLSTNLN